LFWATAIVITVLTDVGVGGTADKIEIPKDVDKNKLLSTITDSAGFVQVTPRRLLTRSTKTPTKEAPTVSIAGWFAYRLFESVTQLKPLYDDFPLVVCNQALTHTVGHVYTAILSHFGSAKIIPENVDKTKSIVFNHFACNYGRQGDRQEIAALQGKGHEVKGKRGEGRLSDREAYVKYILDRKGLLLEALFGTGQYSKVSLMSEDKQEGYLLQPGFQRDGLNIALLTHDLSSPKRKGGGTSQGQGSQKEDQDTMPSQSEDADRRADDKEKGEAFSLVPEPQDKAPGESVGHGDSDVSMTDVELIELVESLKVSRTTLVEDHDRRAAAAGAIFLCYHAGHLYQRDPLPPPSPSSGP
ncbi:hypothetical protein BGZ73_001387, partial [Actinomortierella ambigua]